MDLQSRPKDVMEHRYCVTELKSMKSCTLFSVFVEINFKNVKSLMKTLCNYFKLLFDFFAVFNS